MVSRFLFINSGLYPETLPPCFISKDSKRAFHGLIGSLDQKKFYNIKTEYVRYNGTKHDGNRRFFGTPNIISYFHVSSFIWRHWNKFEKNFNLSAFSIGKPQVMEEDADRSVKVPSLSELSKRASKNISYAPFVLKADIAQCFPSLYTHSIPWAAHGIEESKSDTDEKSKTNVFNALDFFIRNCQRGNTRGVLVGPDAFRLVAEFVLARIDNELSKLVGVKVVGAVRHVDDYYIGLKTEHDAQSVLSHLREVLANFELNINYQKTKIQSSLEPINDLWAQRLRIHLKEFNMFADQETIERGISESISLAKEIGSDSPLKILMRSIDDRRLYRYHNWKFIEQNIQRIVQKHPHTIDYACLLVAKRHALGETIDRPGWSAVAEMIIQRGLALDHHHEVLWMAWLLIVCDIQLPIPMMEALAKSRNAHIRALLVQAFVDGKLARKPKLALGAPLSTIDANWLVNLVARSQEFSKAPFSGNLSDEFDHLANKRIKLIDFQDHITRIQNRNKSAISRVRYGYDDNEGEDENIDWDFLRAHEPEDD